jgi:tRNA pseudouridine55 synthase
MTSKATRPAPSPLEGEGWGGGYSQSPSQPSTPLPAPPPQGGREPRGEGATQLEPPQKQQQKKREKRDVDGWIVLDKPVGMTSTHAVSVVKRAFAAKKAGHAGTLDPLASGILPIALGEATKTVPFVMEGRKAYRFTVRWGVETGTDDAEGRAIGESDVRPSAEAIRAALPAFIGAIMQTPPKYSALKIDGERAYDLAREGEEFTLEARPVDIARLDLVAIPDADHAELEAECGKGTYVRALARDLGRALSTFGHVVALRRTAVGPFAEANAIPVEALARAADAPPLPANAALLLPVVAGLGGLPALTVSRADAARLGRGQAVLMRGRDAPVMDCCVAVSCEGVLVALADAAEGELRPRRIFRLRQGS